jgi:hypothetical protein
MSGEDQLYALSTEGRSVGISDTLDRRSCDNQGGVLTWSPVEAGLFLL